MRRYGGSVPLYLSDGSGLDILKYIKDDEANASMHLCLVSSGIANTTNLTNLRQAGVAGIFQNRLSRFNLSRGLNVSFTNHQYRRN